MRYKLLLLDEETERVEMLGKTDNPDTVAALRQASLTVMGRKPVQASPVILGKPGAKGRQIMVVGKTDDYEGPYRVGDLFDNAKTASTALGFKYNAVSQALAGAQGSAIIRELELTYADTVGKV